MIDISLVSIAMATYNGERFLRDQLDSIFNQTYKNLEVIVTDDCSTDGTLDILEIYSQKYDLKYYINNKNLGRVKNFERALSFCNGKYIALADQDDIWLPEKIENLVNEIGNCSLIFSDAILIDTYGNKIAESFKKTSNYIADTETPFLQLFFRKFIYGCTMLFKRELLEMAFPIPEGVRYHDRWFSIVAAKMGGIRYYDKLLMLYRQHENNVSGDVKDHLFLYKLFRFSLPMYREKRKKIRKETKETIEAALNSALVIKESEKLMLTDSIYFFESFLSNKIDIKVFLIMYKYRDILFSKKKYFILELLMRISCKLLRS